VADQPKIISASRRTDIPAFYASWFMNRIREGFAIYPNPMFPYKKHQVDLRPSAVNGIVFWTRYPAPMLPYLAELDARGYSYYFLVSILNYPRDIEPHTPSIKKTIDAVRMLSEKIGKHRVIWRYDPLILTQGKIDDNWHIHNFSWLLGNLWDVTEKVIISIIDPYQKTVEDLGDGAKGISYQPSDYHKLLMDMSKLTQKAGIRIQSCAEFDMGVPGIIAGGCVDAGLIETISGLKTSKQKHVQRKGCLCQKSVDIGVNNTCLFGCRYCYATSSYQTAQYNQKRHDPKAPSIADNPGFNQYRKHKGFSQK